MRITPVQKGALCVMGLLSQWAPAGQGGAVTEVLRQVNSAHATHRPFLEGLSQLLNR